MNNDTGHEEEKGGEGEPESEERIGEEEEEVLEEVVEEEEEEEDGEPFRFDIETLGLIREARERARETLTTSGREYSREDELAMTFLLLSRMQNERKQSSMRESPIFKDSLHRNGIIDAFALYPDLKKKTSDFEENDDDDLQTQLQVKSVKKHQNIIRLCHSKSNDIGICLFDQQEFVFRPNDDNECHHHYGRISPLFLRKTNFYFEMKVIKVDGKAEIKQAVGIGMIKKGERDSFVGWKDGSIGYHSDSGVIHDNFGNYPDDVKDDAERYLMEAYEDGDVVGCGYNLETGKIFFTKNGKLYSSFESNRNFKELELFPAVTSVCWERNPDVIVEVNLGKDVMNNPFVYSPYNIISQCLNIKAFHDIIIKTIW